MNNLNAMHNDQITSLTLRIIYTIFAISKKGILRLDTYLKANKN